MPSLRNVDYWPTIQEYDKALLKRKETVYDLDIKRGELLQDSSGPMRLNGGAGKYVCVYKVGDWVVRCFTGNPPSNLRERYQTINAYLRTKAEELSFLVPNVWVNQGIYINGQDWPLVKVPYITDNQPLGMFLADHYQDRQLLDLLAKQWLEIVHRLEAAHIAHGDLDLTNILVCANPPNLSLLLIDFDGMFVPDLQGCSLADQGHEHFQSPLPGIRCFNAQMDRFSALVIYLSLIALAEDPSLWEKCDADESTRLLLGFEDFQELGLSHNALLLSKMTQHGNLQKCLWELRASIQQHRMPRSLSEILGTQRNSYQLAPQSIRRLAQSSSSLDIDSKVPSKSIPLPLQFVQGSETINADSEPIITPKSIPLPLQFRRALQTPDSVPIITPKSIPLSLKLTQEPETADPYQVASLPSYRRRTTSSLSSSPSSRLAKVHSRQVTDLRTRSLTKGIGCLILLVVFIALLMFAFQQLQGQPQKPPAGSPTPHTYSPINNPSASMVSVTSITMPIVELSAIRSQTHSVAEH